MQTTHAIHEDDRLNSVLQQDQVLVTSLKSEDRRRKRKRLTLGLLMLIFGAGMGLLFTQSGHASPGEDLAAEGWELWKERRIVEAEEKFAEAVKIAPESTSAWNGLGWARLNQGKSSSALDAFEKCLEIEPSVGAALNGAGQALLSLRKYDEAKTYLLKCAPLAPASWYGLARVSLLQGDFDEAVKWSQKVVNVDPQNTVAAKILAAAKNQKIPDDLQRLIEPPARRSVEALKGWQFINSGRATEAKAHFQKLLEKTPNDFDAMCGLAFSLLNLGNVEEAKPYFEKCIAEKKNNLGAINGLARCLKIEGKTEEAIKLWKDMDETVGHINAGTAGLAYTYLEQGEFKLAIPYFERLVAAAPDRKEFQLRLNAAEIGLKNAK